MATMPDKVNAPLIITTGAVSGLLVIVIVIGLQAWFLSEQQAESARKNENAVNYALADLQTRQIKQLSGNRVVDKDKQVVAIPIEQAMSIVARDNGRIPATQPAK